MTDIFNIIVKDLNNCASESELTRLQEWLKEDENNFILKEQFVNVWKGDYIDLDNTESNIWDKIEKEINTTPSEKPVVPIWQSSYNFLLHNRIKVAASIVLLLASFITYQYFFIDKSAEQKIAENTINYLEYTTQAGQEREVILPDSSMVILKSNSSLRVPNNISFANSRSVELLGQAFFQVNASKENPFVVTSNTFESSVVGTIFNISDYPNDMIQEIVVLEGVVQVALLDDEYSKVNVSKNEMVTYSTTTDKLAKKKLEFRLADWENGNLVFEGDNFDRIVVKLQRHFNTKISIEKKDIDKNKSFIGVFYKDESISDILNILSTQFVFSYEIKKNEVIIK